MTIEDAFLSFIDGNGDQQARDDILHLLAQTINLHVEAKRLRQQKVKLDHIDLFNILLTAKHLIVVPEPEAGPMKPGDLTGLAKAIDRRGITQH